MYVDSNMRSEGHEVVRLALALGLLVRLQLAVLRVVPLCGVNGNALPGCPEFVNT